MMDKAKRYLHKIQLKNKQREVDKLYARDGYTDEVFQKQLEINMKRNEHDIPDEKEMIWENYVQ